MHLEIVTPEKKVFDGEVSSATFPGKDGSFQVLNDHAPIISTLNEGAVKYKNQDGETTFNISGGVVEVLKNKVVLLADHIL